MTLRQAFVRSCAVEGITPRLVVPERTLATVLDDIADVGPIVWRTPSWIQAWQLEAALDRLDELQAEARSMIEAATGVTWDQLQEANL